ncbi:MAG: GGDEF domain-containing protein [Bdellovibrionota bacterium]
MTILVLNHKEKWKLLLFGCIAIFLSCKNTPTSEESTRISFDPSWRVSVNAAAGLPHESEWETTNNLKAIFLPVLPKEGAEIWYKKNFTVRGFINQPMALQLGPIADADRVWIDGKWIGSTHFYGEHFGTGLHDWRAYSIPSSLLEQGDHEIVIQVKKMSPIPGGILNPKKLSILDFETARKHQFIHNFFRTYLVFAFGVSLILIGLYSSLVGFWQRGGNEKFRAFFFVSLFMSLYVIATSFILSPFLKNTWIDSKFVFSAPVLVPYFLYRYISLLRGIKTPRLDRALFAFSIILIICNVMVPVNHSYWVMMFHNIWNVYMVATLTFIGWHIHRWAFKSQSWASRTIIISYYLLIATAARDVIIQVSSPGNVLLNPYAFVLFTLGLSIFLAREHGLAMNDRRRREELAKENRKLRSLAEHDSLTGLLNRRAFENQGKVLFDVCHQNKELLHFIALDLDHFKSYNDAYGHPAGDSLLKEFSQILQRLTRQNDVIARLGGEEFAVVLRSIERKQAEMVANRIRGEIEKYPFEHNLPSGKPVTVSIGLATLHRTHSNFGDLYKEADQALYKAKEFRNCVYFGDPPTIERFVEH